jgi:hypothetical protein
MRRKDVKIRPKATSGRLRPKGFVCLFVIFDNEEPNRTHDNSEKGQRKIDVSILGVPKNT